MLCISGSFLARVDTVGRCWYALSLFLHRTFCRMLSFGDLAPAIVNSGVCDVSSTLLRNSWSELSSEWSDCLPDRCRSCFFCREGEPYPLV